MSLQSVLTSAFQRVGNEAKALRTMINGNVSGLSALTTDAKGNLVAAINELQTEILSLSGGGVTINDSATSAGSTWSSQKIVNSLAALKEEIFGPNVPAALDTLKELADFAQNNKGLIDGLTGAIGNRVRFDAAQSLTSEQQLQARQNIGAVAQADIGDTATNFVSIFETALAS